MNSISSGHVLWKEVCESYYDAPLQTTKYEVTVFAHNRIGQHMKYT